MKFDAAPPSLIVKFIEPVTGAPCVMVRMEFVLSGVHVVPIEYDQLSVHVPAGRLTSEETEGNLVELTKMKGSEGGGLLSPPTIIKPGPNVSRYISSDTPLISHWKSKPKLHAVAAFWMMKITGKGLMRAYVWLSGKTRSTSIVVLSGVEAAAAEATRAKRDVRRESIIQVAGGF
jgi:hypothetical protein